jgi:3-isopropylmalate/(R)-2-methylmalate dehydratase small subunit
MADKFTVLTGAAAPLLRDNIDTDTISPGSRAQKPGVKQEFGEKGSATLARDLFANWRYDNAGKEIRDFVLNRPEFRSAKLLFTGSNFGCGSSRESAVWMLKEWGIRCIVAPSFGEIFTNNCFTNGLLPVTLPKAMVQELAEEAAPGAPTALFSVDLAANALQTPSGRIFRFTLPEFRRRGLLEGLDEIAVTLHDLERIEAFLAEGRQRRPWAYAMPRAGITT